MYPCKRLITTISWVFDFDYDYVSNYKFGLTISTNRDMIASAPGPISPAMNLAKISSQLPGGSAGPVHLEGRPTRRATPHEGNVVEMQSICCLLGGTQFDNSNFS